MKLLSAVVPCYNEAENVEAFQNAVIQTFDGCGYDYEIVFVDDGSKDALIQEMTYSEGKCSFSWRPVRPLPADDDFFENVWRRYRENGNIE